MAPLKIATLEYLWWGVCIGGRHYTGEIRYKDQKEEIRRSLTLRQAKELSETEGRLWLYCHERTTNKFDSYEDLVRAAEKWCRANLGEHWLLLHNDKNNPNKALAAQGPIKARVPLINKLADIWDKIPNSQREGIVWDKTFELWDRLLKI